MEWRFKQWDVRADGKVFWQYHKKCKNGQRWVVWEKAIEYRSSNLKATKELVKSQRGKDLKKLWSKTWRDKHGKDYDKGRRRKKTYRDYRKNYQRSYIKSRRKTDVIFDMACRLRSRIGCMIRKKGYSKTCKTIKMLGCNWDSFAYHIESKFVCGMNWGNRNLWHIDHIVPLSSAKSIDELYKLNHFTNLQPMWAVENMKKGAKTTTSK
jgi:hypothetical protein